VTLKAWSKTERGAHSLERCFFLGGGVSTMGWKPCLGSHSRQMKAWGVLGYNGYTEGHKKGRELMYEVEDQGRLLSSVD